MCQLEKIGLIPAAGRGVRLNLPFPKELFPVFEGNNYYPVAHFTVDRMLQANIQHIIFIINESKHQLVDYFGNGNVYHCYMSYVVQNLGNSSINDSTSPGLAHALDSAYHLTQNKCVFFGMADTIMFPQDTFTLAEKSANNETDVILCLFKTEQPEKFGMVQFEEQSGKVLKIIDKPKSTSLKWMWGCIIWRPKFTEFLHQKVQKENIYDFASIMNLAINAGLRFYAVCFEGGNFIDIGTYNDAKKLYQ